MSTDRFAVPAWWHPYSPTVMFMHLDVRGLWVTIGAYCAHMGRDAMPRSELLRITPEKPTRTQAYLAELIDCGLAEMVDGDMVRLTTADPLIGARLEEVDA